jgi:hypothetical protein
MAIKFTNWQQNIPNSYKIYQQGLIQDLPKLAQNGIFGLKTNHLATPLRTSPSNKTPSVSGLPDFLCTTNPNRKNVPNDF